jgi:putative transposase
METQTQLSESYTQIQVRKYKHHETSVGSNLMTIQITTKYRYCMMRTEKIETFCRVSIEEACRRHKIDVIILEVLKEHAHLIVDCPRTMSVAMLMQIIKGLSAYILFRICPNLRKRYPNGHFWSEGYFCEGCGSDFEKALAYVKNQKLHHME